MKVAYIKIENYKGISNFEIDGLANVNVIAGINGAGKTTILTAVKVLLSWLIARIHNPKGRGLAIKDSDITKGRDYCFLKIRLSDNTEWQIYKQHSKVRTKPVYKTDMVAMTVLADRIATAAKENPNKDVTLIDAYGVNRAVSGTPIRVRKTHKLHPLDALNVDMSNSVNFHDFFIWFREMEDIENEGLRNTGTLNKDRRLEAVRNTIGNIIEGYSNFKVQRSPKAFVISKDNVEFDFNDLSDGEKAYLTLISDIARKLAMCHPELANPLVGDGIILIDEIDLHLHPTWQREVKETLRRKFPNCQFLITTHSPHIVASVSPMDDDKLITVNKGVASEVLGNQYGKEPDMVLSDVFGMKSLRTPLVQEHIDNVWNCLSEGDFRSNDFKDNMQWLQEHVDRGDSVFAQINMQIKLIQKGVV